MADRYQSLTGTPIGRLLVKNLGLPNPTPLTRYTDGEPSVTGLVLIGGSGRLRAVAEQAITAAGGEVATAPDPESRFHGLVFDASGIESTDQLVAAHEFLSPVGRSLEKCGRIVVLGTDPDQAATTSAHIAQRALEGLTRSLGKEIGRGSTVQLVYAAPGAEDRLGSTLSFLLSPKSAYVSGQVIRVGTDLTVDPGKVDPQAPLAGKVALVTGASRGIGAAIAATLHRDGATIVGVDVPQAASDLQTVMDELDGHRVSLDITAVDAPQRLAATLDAEYGGVDIVVHNAGITRDKKLVNMATDRWTSVLDVNLSAPERITTELLEHDVIRGNGRVIGVASIAGIAGNAGQTNYATSKAGVIGLVDAMSSIAASKGVTINAVAPGFIETQMTAKIPLVIREAGRRMNSLSQGGLPIDVAETIAWFAHPASYGITGNVVRVCGQSLLGA